MRLIFLVRLTLAKTARREAGEDPRNKVDATLLWGSIDPDFEWGGFIIVLQDELCFLNQLERDEDPMAKVGALRGLGLLAYDRSQTKGSKAYGQLEGDSSAAVGQGDEDEYDDQEAGGDLADRGDYRKSDEKEETGGIHRGPGLHRFTMKLCQRFMEDDETYYGIRCEAAALLCHPDVSFFRCSAVVHLYDYLRSRLINPLSEYVSDGFLSYYSYALSPVVVVLNQKLAFVCMQSRTIL